MSSIVNHRLSSLSAPRHNTQLAVIIRKKLSCDNAIFLRVVSHCGHTDSQCHHDFTTALLKMANNAIRLLS